MQMIETNVEQRGLLPLPSAALVIDMRGVNDDDVVEWLSIEIADLAGEMKSHNVHHWRYLSEFLSFMRIAPAREEPAQPAPAEDDQLRQGLTGRFQPLQPGHFLLDETDILQSDQHDTAFGPFAQKIDELVQEIDRIRTNRIAAVADLNKAGIPGRSSRDETVRVIFLTDAARPDSLTSSSLYAERIKDYYRKLDRPGRQPLVNTTIVCLSNRGEIGSLPVLIRGLIRNNKLDHWDSLILSEDYRDDAAMIAGTIQAYVAELLLYVLLIIPPLSVSSPTLEQAALPQGGGAGKPEEETISLPANTFIVGLAALEYSARWGRRWLNFGLAKEAIEMLLKKPVDAIKEDVIIADAADAWFRDWSTRVRATIPDNTPDAIPALQGIYHARHTADPAKRIFTARRLSINIGKSSISDLQAYLTRLTQTYVSSTNEPALQDALSQSTPQIMQALHENDDKGTDERSVTDLGRLQVEAEQVLSDARFFTRASGSVLRASRQLWFLSTVISRFHQEHENNPLSPLSMKDNMQTRRKELEQAGNAMIEGLEKHLKSWPFFTSLLLLKQTFAVLTLLLIMFLSMVTILLGFAWLHHLILLKAASSFSFVNSAVMGIPMLELSAWLVVLLFFAVEVIAFKPRLINQQRTPLEVEISFVIVLLIFAIYGWFVSYSLDSFKSLSEEATSIGYLAWLSQLPSWSFIVGLIALILIIVESAYFFWWLNHLHKEREHIVSELSTQHQNDIRDVTNFIADDITLEILQRAELTDGDGGPGGYYFRVDHLCDLLQEVLEKAQHQQQLAANRLLLSQSETQQGMELTPNKGTWLNLHIRDEKLEIEALIDSYKELREKMMASNETLRELAEFLLRVEGVEKPIAVGQQLAARSAAANNEKRQFHLLMTTLVAVAMRFAIEPLTTRSIELITEHYRRTDEQIQQHLPTLNALIRLLNKKASEATLQALTTNATPVGYSIDMVHSSIAADTIALWAQLFWQQNQPKLNQTLMQDGVLTQLIRLLQNDYDPRAIMRRLLMHAVLFGRSMSAQRNSDVYLLLSPSPQSYRFRQGLKSMRLPSMIDFPDVERILLLGCQRYIAPPVPLSAFCVGSAQAAGANGQAPDPAASNTSPLAEEEDAVAQQPAPAPASNGSTPPQQASGSNAASTGGQQDNSNAAVPQQSATP